MRSIALIIGLLFIVACNSDYNKYETMLEEEIRSDIRYDSLFLGIHFGMTKKEFFAHCWKMNKQGYFVQGPKNLSVEYDLKDALSFPGSLRFYPQFHDDKIYRMPCEVNYNSIVPGNEKLSSTALLKEVKALMEEWYGTGFIYLEKAEGVGLYVKVDGNRRIRIFKKDLFTVAIDITDMPVYLQINDLDEEG